MIFDVFSCRELNDSVSVLRADTRISCHSSESYVLRAGGIFMVLAWVIGVPAYWLWGLIRNREEIQSVGNDGQESTKGQQFSFLLGEYKCGLPRLSPDTLPHAQDFAARLWSSCVRSPRRLTAACACLKTRTAGASSIYGKSAR